MGGDRESAQAAPSAPSARPAPASGAPPREALRAATRIVVKIGSALLAEPASGEPFRFFAEELRWLQGSDRSIVLVSSGAIAQGRIDCAYEGRPRRLAHAQALAAVGQPALIRRWGEALAPLKVAQFLLTGADMRDPERFLNARRALRALAGDGYLPIGNENDTVATEEIRIGDNDQLAAYVAQLVDADLLIILTQVDGLFSADPRRTVDVTHFPEIAEETLEAYLGHAEEASAEGWGTGGMRAKLSAAQQALALGVPVLIADGRRGLRRLFEEPAAGTLLVPRPRPGSWLLRRWPVVGQLTLSEAAAAALRAGEALWPDQVTEVEGDFPRGALLTLRSPREPLGRGLVGYSAGELKEAMRTPREGLPELFGKGYDGPLIEAEDWTPWPRSEPHTPHSPPAGAPLPG